MCSIRHKPEYTPVERDKTVIGTAAQMLRMVIRVNLASSAQIISVARLLHVLERFPRVADTGPLSVTLTSPKRRYGQTETYFWWEVVWTEATVRVSGGGHYHHPSTGGDSFSVFDWEAEPGSQGEYLDYTPLLHMVPDVKDFEPAVQEMNLYEPGYSVRVNDESNGLLDDVSGADEPDGNGEHPTAGSTGERPRPWTAVAYDAAEQEYCALIDPDEVDASEAVYADGMDDCGICGCLLADRGIAIDGSLKGTSMWGNFCAACHSKAGQGVGWGVGQVYARQADASWRLVAGFPR
jgi:hypothetical protein